MAAARAYRDRILAAVPQGHNFTPLMTCYLTNSLAASELVNGFEQGVYRRQAVSGQRYDQLQPRRQRRDRHLPAVRTDAKIGMPLLIHGEVTDPAVDIFDREARFIEQVMEPIRRQFPELKIVFEHITTKEAAQYVQAGNRFLGATITPQHLMFNRNHMLVGGIRPHLFCLPILKRNVHQEALRQAVASGSDRFFLGTDSAPHLKHRKESSCGCAGCFNAPNAIPAYAAVFEQLGALEHFEAFCSLNGPRFYGLPLNEDFIELQRVPTTQPEEIALGNESVIPSWPVKP